MTLSGEVELGSTEFSKLNIAARRDLPVLASILRKAVEAADPQEVKALRQGWLGATAVSQKRPEIELTDKEIAWLADHKIIRLGVDPSSPPFEFIDEGNLYQGIASDYVRLINGRLGTKMERVQGLSWLQVIEGINNRSVDVLPAASRTPARERTMSFTQAYSELPVVVLTRDDYPFVAGLEDLTARMVALVNGFAVTELAMAQVPKIVQYEVATALEALQAVSLGHAEATVMNLAVATHLLKRHNLANIKVAAPAGIELPGLSFAVRKDWPELVGILNKVLGSITPEEESAINAKWIAVRFEHVTDRSALIRLGTQVGGVALVIVLVIFIWNRRLQKEVRQRKLAESDMEAAKNEAERLTQAKSDFIAVISHEIRTPMNGVLGMARLLTETQLDKEQSECVDTVVESGEALLTIIDDLLDISKIDAGKLEIESLPFLVNEVVGHAIALMKSRADEKGLPLSSVIDAQIPDVVVGDPLRIRQIMLNLISNSVKFTDEGSVTVEARLDSQTDTAAILSFIVTDTGKGISPEAQKTLFFDYDQGSATVARKYGGTGLGLAICRRLADMMDGEITVESAVGKGSTFRFRASFEIDKVTDVELLRKRIRSDASSPVGNRGTHSLSVLQVEDNKTNRVVIERILTRVGHRVSSVVDGEKALEALKAGEFDVVLMDRHMPVMDGLEATRRIRKMPGAVASIPIFGLTASASQDDIDACIGAGMNDCFGKPVDAMELRALLDGLGSESRSTSPTQSPMIDEEKPLAVELDQPPIDLNQLAKILGADDDEELFFVLDMFNGEFPKLFAKLETAIADREPQSTHDCAHAAKGAAANAGAHMLTELLQELEVDAHLENWTEGESRMEAVKSEYARVVRFCQDRRQVAEVT